MERQANFASQLGFLTVFSVYFSFVKSNTKYHISLILPSWNCGRIGVNRGRSHGPQQWVRVFPQDPISDSPLGLSHNRDQDNAALQPFLFQSVVVTRCRLGGALTIANAMGT